MKLCLAGPITGYPYHNTPAFTEAAAALRAAGYEVANPRENYGGRTDLSHADYMRASIVALLGCDGVALLEGWTHSEGATLEWRVAKTIGLPVKRWRQWADA